MHIVIPTQVQDVESRVAASPDTIKKMVAMGHQVSVESNAGHRAFISDEAYQAAGAQIEVSRQRLLEQGDIILTVRSLPRVDLEHIREGALLIGMLAPYQNNDLDLMVERKITAFSLELLPRTTRAQSMDVLSSQNNIAGYKAVLMAAECYPRFMPMLMTAAGTVKPAKVLIMGVGVAGLQAIATAKRLGAIVEAFDVRASAKEQVESLGGKFIEVPVSEEEKANNNGVYAKEMSDSYRQAQQVLVNKHVKLADIVITTALIPGKKAPILITQAMVDSMKPGSVIVDIAAELGGNCEATHPNEHYISDSGVHIIGRFNVAGSLPFDASNLYSKNVQTFLNLMLSKEGLNINLEDDLLSASLITHAGKLHFTPNS